MKLTTNMSQVISAFEAVKLGHDWVTGNWREAKIDSGIVQCLKQPRRTGSLRFDGRDAVFGCDTGSLIALFLLVDIFSLIFFHAMASSWPTKLHTIFRSAWDSSYFTVTWPEISKRVLGKSYSVFFYLGLIREY
jgi:hypothetical protein